MSINEIRWTGNGKCEIMNIPYITPGTGNGKHQHSIEVNGAKEA